MRNLVNIVFAFLLLFQFDANSQCDALSINFVSGEVQSGETQSHQANWLIISSIPIYSGANVTYLAGDYIDLRPGFRAENGSVFDARIGDCSTSQKNSIEEMEVSLDDLSLLDNYPNPFSQSTTIEFNLPESTLVQLQVYDMTGKMVASLIEDEILEAGKHSSRFEAGDLTNGIYTYVLMYGDKTISKKMMLMQ